MLIVLSVPLDSSTEIIFVYISVVVDRAFLYPLSQVSLLKPALGGRKALPPISEGDKRLSNR